MTSSDTTARPPRQHSQNESKSPVGSFDTEELIGIIAIGLYVYILYVVYQTDKTNYARAFIMPSTGVVFAIDYVHLTATVTSYANQSNVCAVNAPIKPTASIGGHVLVYMNGLGECNMEITITFENTLLLCLGSVIAVPLLFGLGVVLFRLFSTAYEFVCLQKQHTKLA